MENNKKTKLNIPARHLAILKPVLIGFFLILVIILSAVVMDFSDNSGAEDADRYAETQEALSLEEQTRLTEISEHLKSIDKIVMTNKEQLSGVSLAGTDMEKTLGSFWEALSYLENHLATVETSLQEFAETSDTENTAANTAISDLLTSQTENKEQTTAAIENITALLADIQSGSENSFSETYDMLNTLQQSGTSIKRDIESYYKDLVETAESLQNENQTEHKELIKTLTAVAEETETLINDHFSDLELLLDHEYTSLISKMDSLHIKISGTEQSITYLLSMMSAQDEKNQEEIRELFTAVGNSLEQINTDFNEAHLQIQNQIATLQEAGAANHEETLSALTEMEGNMTAGADQNLDQINSALRTIQDNVNNSITAMQSEMSQSFQTLDGNIDNSLAEYNSYISGQLEQIGETITNQYNSLSSTVNNYSSDQQTSYDSLLNEIQDGLQSVFQSVSDGKKEIASALLTKNVTINEDATFDEIVHGILDVPQELVIEGQQFPGTIEYEYHHHTAECYSTCNVTLTIGEEWSRYSDYYDTTFYHVSWREVHSLCGTKSGEWVTNGKSNNKNPGTTYSTHQVLTCGLQEGQIVGAHISYDQPVPAGTRLALPAHSHEEITDTITEVSVSDNYLTIPE